MYNIFFKNQKLFDRNRQLMGKMSRTSLLFTLFFIVALNCMAISGYSQTVRMSMMIDNPNLKDAMIEIKKQTEFDFLYSKDIESLYVASTRISVENGSIEEILNQLFENSRIDYKIIDKTIVFMPRAMERTGSVQQGITITGIVTDAFGEPLPGVTVQIKGVAQGTATDVNGAFSLSVPDGNATLVFSYIGFTTQEILVGNQRTINITLVDDTRQLEEVVVIGYGTMKKRDLTGAVAQMKAEAVANEAPKSVQDILRANVAGLNIGYSTGAKPGGDLQVRGTNTLKAGTSPLIVLDGAIYTGGLEDINPYDIETVDVLKDASSAAVFGAKSASGVVLITTKKGKQGKPTVNFNSTIGIITMGVDQPVYDGPGFIKWRSDVAKSINVVQAANNPGMYDDPRTLPAGVTQEQWLSYDTNDGDPQKTWFTRLFMQPIEYENYLKGKETDWYSKVFRPGFQQDHNISLSGKKDDLTYYWSLGYTDNDGLVYGDHYSILRSRVTLDANITKFFNVGLSTQFAYRDESAIAANWGSVLSASPWGDMYNEDGTYKRYPVNESSSGNPFYDKSHTSRSKTYATLNSSLYAKITIPLNITFQTTFIPRLAFHNYMNHQKATHVDWARRGGMVQRQNDKSLNWQVDNLLKWNKTFGIHSFDITLLQNAEKFQNWNTYANNEMFVPNDLLGYHYLKGGTMPTVDSTDEISTGSAYMARLFYSLMDRYMITGTVRRDGYSAFGQLHPWANFGSFALAWRFTDENFWKGNLKNILEDGKLRVSYGTNGNRDIGRYAALSDLNSTGKYYYANATTGAIYQSSQLWAQRMNNKDLKWESTASLNAGLDFTIHRQIVDGSIEVYRASTTDLLMERALPVLSGYTVVLTNMGEVQNNGLEITLNSNNIRKEKLNWRTSFTFSMNKNKIVHLYGNMVDVVDANGNVTGQKEADDTVNKWFIGRPIGQIWDFKPIGVWQTNEAEEAYKYNGQYPGDFKLYDPDGNYRLENSDKQFIGQTSPKFRWNLRNDLTFLDNFNLSFMLYSYWGHKKQYDRPKNNYPSSTYRDRTSDYVLPYWTPENPINTHARMMSREAAAFDLFWDNSFIRFDNISLAYNIPAHLLQKASIQNLRLYLTIRNVAVWTPKWEFWDPENNGPTPRYFTFGLNMTL